MKFRAVYLAALILLSSITSAQKTAPVGSQKPKGFYEVLLPEGEHGSINIGWFRNGAQVMDPKVWMDDGDDSDPEPDDHIGIRFTGQGVDKTILRCSSWDGITLAVGRHKGIVAFRNMTVYAGSDRATAFGQQQIATAKVKEPGFQINLNNVRFAANPPGADGKRTKWLVFSYNADLFIRDCTFDGLDLAEHDLYAHGFAKYGMLVERCRFNSSGAEQLKVRSDTTETVWAGPQAKVVVRDSSFTNWHQPHSWRGGAGIVLQGAGCDVLIERCLLVGGRKLGTIPANDRSLAIMISSEGLSYDAVTGVPSVGFGTGHVVIRDSVLWGHSDVDWRNTIIRVDRNGGSQQAARSVLIENCGVWGTNMAVSFGNVPAGKVTIRGCNTPAIRARSESLGLDTSIQAYLPTSTRKVPLVEAGGVVR